MLRLSEVGRIAEIETFWTGLTFQQVRFLGQKGGETCWDLNTSSEGNKLSFPTPTKNTFSITRATATAV
jgi:hypothetical protein